ncbi:MAG: thioredoxin domain-containing protein [Deltaproteobacteria bacterium]|nr:thioredoxin domain-containing protein [Deltaproteobacteria bacterium]MBN2674681.1 thioredoxin domain-containing protein [Deltaproteobacteria bacterium]
MPKGMFPKKLFVIIVFLSLLGIGVSAKLLHIHVMTHTDPEFHSLCAVSDSVNCETVALSPYSVFLFLPVCLWGILGYSILAGVSVTSLIRGRRGGTFLLGTFFLLCVFAVGASAVLAIISFTKIDSLCLFCLSSYIINIGLLVLTGVAFKVAPKRPGTAIVEDIRYFVTHPLLSSALVFVIAALLVVLSRTVPHYWESRKWLDMAALNTGVDNNGDHWIGAIRPSLTIVEYSDYQCPHCRLAQKKLRILLEDYANDVRLIHRQFPLDMACNDMVKRRFHDYACVFSYAAECAGNQEKFWEMNDALFGAQENAKADAVSIETIAIELGLDRSQFNECMEQKLPSLKIKNDIESGRASGVTGTPSYIVGTRKFVGGISKAQLETALKNSSNAR